MSIPELSMFSNSRLFAIRDAVLPELNSYNNAKIVNYSGLTLLCGKVNDLFFLLDITNQQASHSSLVFFKATLTMKEIDQENPGVMFLNQGVELGKEPLSLEVLKPGILGHNPALKGLY